MSLKHYVSIDQSQSSTPHHQLHTPGEHSSKKVIK